MQRAGALLEFYIIAGRNVFFNTKQFNNEAIDKGRIFLVLLGSIATASLDTSALLLAPPSPPPPPTCSLFVSTIFVNEDKKKFNPV